MQWTREFYQKFPWKTVGPTDDYKSSTSMNHVYFAINIGPRTKVNMLTFNQLLQLVFHPLWSGWFRPASQSLMPRPTHWRQQSKRSSLSTSGLAQCDHKTVVVIILKVTCIQHQERPHQHRLRHLQWKITQLLQTSERRLQFSHHFADTLLLV